MTTLIDGDPRLTRKLKSKPKPKPQGFEFTTTITYKSVLTVEDIFPDGLPKGKTNPTVDDVVNAITDYMNDAEINSMRDFVGEWNLTDDWDSSEVEVNIEETK